MADVFSPVRWRHGEVVPPGCAWGETCDCLCIACGWSSKPCGRQQVQESGDVCAARRKCIGGTTPCESTGHPGCVPIE